LDLKCIFKAFSNQVNGLSVVFGTGMLVEKIVSKHISQYKELATIIRHECNLNIQSTLFYRKKFTLKVYKLP
jgi:hypothetical protein